MDEKLRELNFNQLKFASELDKIMHKMADGVPLDSVVPRLREFNRRFFEHTAELNKFVVEVMDG